MSDTKFTPGPWHVDADTNPIMIYRDDSVIAEVEVSCGESDHDAHLIAAAPDLYAALANLVEMAMARSADGWDEAVREGYAALTKARGE